MRGVDRARFLSTPVRLLVAAAMLLATTGVMVRGALAHNLSYALASVAFPPSRVRVEIRCHLPALIMGVQQSALSDQMLPQFVALTDAAMLAREESARRAFLSAFSLRADGHLIDDVELIFPGPAALRADALTPKFSPSPSPPMIITAALPRGVGAVDLALPPELGAAVVVVRYPDGQTSTEAMADGERTHAIRVAGPRPWHDAVDALARYVALGFRHILPLGLDHILFIVALAVGTPRLVPLVKLATAFTVAHSITLALAAFRLVEAPPRLIEPAIALSIAAVALLTVLRPRAAESRERLGIVFAFGLLHGLGFASALRATGLPRGQEAIGLAGFNIGVEFGQITVILGVLGLVGWWRARPSYHTWVAVPISAVIAAAGLFWTVQRILESTGTAGFGEL